MKFSLPWKRVKLANVCKVLATRVKLRVARDDGNSEIKENFHKNYGQLQLKSECLPLVILNKLGDNIAGHRNRKNMEADIKLSAIS